MKSSQTLVIIFCLSLVLVAAGCTDSKPSEKTPAQATEQPTPTTVALKKEKSTGESLTVYLLDVGQRDLA